MSIFDSVVDSSIVYHGILTFSIFLTFTLTHTAKVTSLERERAKPSSAICTLKRTVPYIGVP